MDPAAELYAAVMRQLGIHRESLTDLAGNAVKDIQA
jgi:hypothetical protein